MSVLPVLHRAYLRACVRRRWRAAAAGLPHMELRALASGLPFRRASHSALEGCGHAIVEKTADRWEDHVVTVKIRSDL